VQIHSTLKNKKGNMTGLRPRLRQPRRQLEEQRLLQRLREEGSDPGEELELAPLEGEGQGAELDPRWAAMAGYRACATAQSCFPAINMEQMKNKVES
jgi:hypothetical protein